MARLLCLNAQALSLKAVFMLSVAFALFEESACGTFGAWLLFIRVLISLLI